MVRKVLCCGTCKTGTTSLFKGLEKLGITTTPNPTIDFVNSVYTAHGFVWDESVVDVPGLESFEGFQDAPYSNNYRYFDKKFGSDCKFILTVRDSQKWFDSLYRYYNMPGYMSPVWLKNMFDRTEVRDNDRDHFVRVYEKYNRDVIEYFGERVLVLDFEKQSSDEIWAALCGHLGTGNVPPTEDFPHENRCDELRITYTIQVCNESRELYSLINFLVKTIDPCDNINVIVDSLHKTDKVQSVLEHFGRHITVFERPFDDFCKNSQFHIDTATGDYIFGLDADEIPQILLMKQIKKIIKETDFDILFMPRINIHPGITIEDLNRHKFNMNENGFINWPDYQGRLYKRCDYIRWTDTLHTKLVGAKKPVALSADPALGIWHIKSMEKQSSRWAIDEKGESTIAAPTTASLYDRLM